MVTNSDRGAVCVCLRSTKSIWDVGGSFCSWTKFARLYAYAGRGFIMEVRVCVCVCVCVYYKRDRWRRRVRMKSRDKRTE